MSGCFVSPQQEDPFRVKPSVFNSQLLEHPSDPFHSEDPFKTDPFKGDWLCLLSVSTVRVESFPLLLLFFAGVFIMVSLGLVCTEAQCIHLANKKKTVF